MQSWGKSFLALSLVLATARPASALPPMVDFVGIEKTESGFNLNFTQNQTEKITLEDDDGVATLGVMLRMYADKYQHATADERKKWEAEVPNSASMKSILVDALALAVKNYEASIPQGGNFVTDGQRKSHLAALKELKGIENSIKLAKKPGVNKDDLNRVAEWVEKNHDASSYSTIVKKGKEETKNENVKLASKEFLSGAFTGRAPMFSITGAPSGSKSRAIFNPDLDAITSRYKRLNEGGLPRSNGAKPQEKEGSSGGSIENKKYKIEKP